MAQLPGTFDPNQVQVDDSFEVMPPDDYLVQVVQSEIRPTNAGTGQYIWLELDVLDGKYTGRKVWDRINIINPNPKAQQIGEKILAQLCKSVGVAAATDTEQFHFKPMIATIKVQPASGQYDASNQVKAYKARDAAGVNQPSAPIAHAPVAAAAESQPPANDPAPVKSAFPWQQQQGS